MTVKNRLLLLLIVVIGFSLRGYHLGKESLWADEGASAFYSRMSLKESFATVLNEDVHIPIYYSLLHFWIKIFGDSEFSLRFPSVIFGVLVILMMYKVGSLLFDKNTGIMSSLITCFSIFHIQLSQEARAYSLMAFLMLLSMFFFLKLLNKESIVNAIGYIVSSVLLIYIHYFGIQILLVQNIYLGSMFLLNRGFFFTLAEVDFISIHCYYFAYTYDNNRNTANASFGNIAE